MNPVRASLHYPQVTLVISAVLVAAGVTALATMPRREDPKITIPTGIVAAFYPGATAEEVENQVTHKIEERLFRFSEVRKEKTFSTSRNGLVVVNVELEDFVRDTDRFWSKLRLEMAQLKATELPEGVRGPIVDSDFGDTVAVLIAVHGGQYGYPQLKEYAQRIEAELRTIRAASRIRRLGEQKETIEITSSLERLSQYSVNPLRVVQALQGRNNVQFAGTVPTREGKVPIQTNNPFQTDAQIRAVMIDLSPTGQPVYVGDIARVDRVYKDPDQYARIDGERAILLSVEMQEGNNIVDFGNEVRRTLDRTRPFLPPDLKLDLVADQPNVVSNRIRSFIREFGIAIGAVILVTILLLPFRVAVISAIAIPVTIAITFGALNAFGIELHQVSIAALILVLGMVVDDAIVIADNYVELLDHAVPIGEAAWRSATGLAVPVLTATLTIIGSFLPLLLLSGAVGEFIRALPIAVAIALGSSFLVAMLLTPLLARFFIKKGLHDQSEGASKTRKRGPLDYMQQIYNRTITRAMRRRGLILAAGFLTMVIGLAILKMVPQQFFPTAERNQFIIDVWLPEGSRIEATDAAVRRIENVLRRESLVSSYTSFLGGSAPRFYYNVNPQFPAPNYAQMVINTRSADETPALIYALRPRLASATPEAKVYVKELEQGKVLQAPVEIRIIGAEIPAMKQLGERVQDILRRTPGAIYVHTDWHEDSYRLKVNVREEVANRLGFTNASIAQQLAGGFEGAPVTTYWEGDRDVPVLLRLGKDQRQSFQNVGETYVTSVLTGARVPLASIVSTYPEWDPARIVRRNGVRTLTVRAFPDEHHLASQVLNAALPALRAIPLPAGYRMELGGEDANQRETFTEMLHALAISLVVIFMILLFQFRTVLDPLIVMTAIPLAVPGAAVGLLLTNNPFGFTAFLGIVALGGVVVRNSIILVDYIRERRKEGVPLEQAALEAGERRLRPIFLTTMAAAVGVTPMILSGSSLWSPLASALAFGLLASMFFTLGVIPTLYVTLHRRSAMRGPAVAAALVLCFAGASYAQPRRITLDEAVDMAIKQNSAVKITKLKAREAEARIAGARANYFPTLQNETAAVRTAETEVLTIPRGSLGLYPSAGAIPGKDIPIQLGNQNWVLSSTTLAQPITHYFKIRAGVDVARADAASAREDARKAENEVALKVKELYYGLLGTGRRRDAVRLGIQAAEERLAEARNAVESGTVLELKVVEGRAQIAQARHSLGQLEDAIEDLTLEFDELLGLPLDTEVELAPPAGDGDNGTAVVETAVDGNPDVRAAQDTLDKARAGLRAARAEYIPEVGAFAQHIYQTGVPLLSRNNSAVGLRLKWTVFEFGKRRAAVQERESQVAEAEENLRRMRNRVRIDLEKAGRKLRRAESGVLAAQESVAAHQEARRVAGDQVQAGTANPSELKQAEAALAASEADLLQAELNRSTAEAELRRTAGGR